MKIIPRFPQSSLCLFPKFIPQITNTFLTQKWVQERESLMTKKFSTGSLNEEPPVKKDETNTEKEIDKNLEKRTVLTVVIAVAMVYVFIFHPEVYGFLILSFIFIGFPLIMFLAIASVIASWFF